MKKSDFCIKKSKVDDGYIGFYKPCPCLTSFGKTEEEAFDKIIKAAKEKEANREALRQFVIMQEEAQKDIPRLLAKLKEIGDKYERKRKQENK